MEIAEFLLARIAEDREVAEGAELGPWTADRGSVWVGHPSNAVVDYSGGGNAEHIARWDPARVLAECEAKRRIVDHVSDQWDDAGFPTDGRTSTWLPDDWERVLRLLALPYASHPDYRAEWALEAHAV